MSATPEQIAERIAVEMERLAGTYDEAGVISIYREDIFAAAKIIRAQAERVKNLEEAARALIDAHGDTRGIDFVGWCKVLSDKVAALEATLKAAP